jgi:hypothetical protein
MFHILEREMQWRREHGKPEGFRTLRAHRPIVAVGADEPLEDQGILGDHFRRPPISSLFSRLCFVALISGSRPIWSFAGYGDVAEIRR